MAEGKAEAAAICFGHLRGGRFAGQCTAAQPVRGARPPAYNSFVATFCDALGRRARRPTCLEDKEVPLLHAQRAAEVLIDGDAGTEDEEIRPAGILKRVAEVLDHLRGFQAPLLAG